jgi:two-component system, NtrC family, sensor kinase
MADGSPRPDLRDAVSERRRRVVPSLALAMVAAVAAVGAVAYWDEERESAAALQDFGQEQATLARSVASAVQLRLAAERSTPDPLAAADGFRALERPHALLVLLLPPGAGRFRATDGQTVESAPLLGALERGDAVLRLSPQEAFAIGLPSRTALAGLARVEAGGQGRWGVAVVANAQRLRDREFGARRRLVLAIALAAGLVLAFGGTALRRQRKELELERELAVAEVERQRDERLERADRVATLGTFAVGIAHEIATPLGVIAGRAEQLLPAVAGDERGTLAVRAILEQTARIEQVIRSFLGLVRGDSPPAQDLSPAEVAARALALCEHRFARAGVSLEGDVAEGLPSMRGDPRLVEHALVNLLLNACDACEMGGHVRLTVSGGDAVAFVIADDGVGIPSADAARVAEPFFTRKPIGQGSGLGLAIVAEIAKHHRGTFELRPGARRGTVARLEFPAAGRPA